MGGFLRAALSAEEGALLDGAAAFSERTVRPNANEWERSRRQPVEALREAASLGLLRLEAPKEQGGLGHRYLVKLALSEEMSRADMAFTFSMVNTQNVAARLALSPAAHHREEYVPALMSGEIFGATALSEPGAGSDFSSIRTRAEKSAGGWRLDGEKGWITNAAIADLFITYVQTDPSAGWRGIACFLVDARKPGFARRPAYGLMGGHAIGAGGFALENYAASEEDMIAPPGEAFKLAMKGVNGARVYVAAMCAGLLGDALETALTYGAERRAFGKSLLEHQGLNWSLGDVANDLEALRGLVAHAGHLIDREEDAVMAAAHAKKFAGRVTLPRLADCIQAMGAAGLREEYGLHRHLACAKIAAYTDGSTEIMNERIGAGLMKEYGPV
ncbi:acyl-CoA dehydrogenase family protein [Parvibaculum sp.]|uniref:acyl-CoA dehydrogenase family protein n=2 Tax=Parvibaculum sp. TaxID=2024848 RepID=UPI001AFEC438|nr:acyl-CoA dehydrogenase family protein [Parvibaculum sp.]MBO6678142.1 acyl-CoA/acyl-ACP dehydrogenase [Parvibaculum sp.]MBO6683710.1 acyl-CoA/acyl-ACP dehydrogenase [Parvibaculum sp.]MBO6904752.1 acyl-CoA/acyl-ACP dehydrogenase [Parvibaculum sp.]